MQLKCHVDGKTWSQINILVFNCPLITKILILMTTFAARGQWIKLIINEKFIGKKVKIWKFWEKPMLCTSKKSFEHVEIRFRCKKFDFLWKKSIFSIFRFLFQKGDPLVSERKNFFSRFFKNFKFFSEKWLQWDL